MASLGAWGWLVNKATDGIENVANYASGVKQRYEDRQAESSPQQAPAAKPAQAADTLRAASDTPQNAMNEADAESK